MQHGHGDQNHDVSIHACRYFIGHYVGRVVDDQTLMDIENGIRSIKMAGGRGWHLHSVKVLDDGSICAYIKGVPMLDRHNVAIIVEPGETILVPVTGVGHAKGGFARRTISG